MKRNLSTPESRLFWAGVDKTAARVDAWPDWMKGIVPLIKTNRAPIIEAAHEIHKFLYDKGIIEKFVPKGYAHGIDFEADLAEIMSNIINESKKHQKQTDQPAC